MTSEVQSNSVDITECYQRAQRWLCFDSDKLALNTTVIPNWTEQASVFWYLRESFVNGESANGTAKAFRKVDAKQASNEPAFDHTALATALAAASGERVDSDHLPFDTIEIIGSSEHIRFAAFNQHWDYHCDSQTCEAIAPSVEPVGGKLSPDGNKVLFAQGGNLWLRDVATGLDKALTDDGERFYAYASTASAYGRQEMPSLEALWSPDSKRVFTLVKDTRKVRVGPPIVRHVPPTDGQSPDDVRPYIHDPERRMATPGDEHVEGYYFLAIDVETQERTPADYRLCPVAFPPYIGFFTSGQGWWSQDNRHAYFIDLERRGLVGRLVEFDTHTGATRVVVEEASKTRFNFTPISHMGPLLTPLPESNEVVWYSARSGWAHLYLYDMSTGALKNPITQGDWLVRNILHVDVERRELLIQTAGRVDGRDPYYRDICRVDIDTGELTPVLSSDHEYWVCDPKGRCSLFQQGVSPGGQYLVTTRSKMDEVPTSVLLDRSGKVVLELETADVSGLPEGWHWPEPVALKAADGQTDIYGVVFRPSGFSPDKSYPILDFSSVGDYIGAGSFGNNIGGSMMSFTNPAAYAELGFMVVMIRSRGTALRSKAFSSDKDTPQLHCSHQDDCIAGIQQLAERYPYMDARRVGLGGYGSPPSALNGLLKYPDFYSVGVGRGMFPDTRIIWNAFEETLCDEGQSHEEFWAPHRYEHLVGNLKGKLLLIHGMLDNATPVTSAFRVIEALRLANKDFDLLLLPNLGHAGSCAYMIRRTWDYFVRHLQQVEPPKEFELPSSLEFDDPTI